MGEMADRERELEIPVEFDQDPIGACDQCERRAWVPESIGSRCRMPQPNGRVCTGTFQPLDAEVVEPEPTYKTNHGRELAAPARLPEPAEEVLDGEIDRTVSGIRWTFWRDPMKFTLHFKLEVDDVWYREVDRDDADRLNACVEEIKRLTEITRGQRPKGGNW
jgi:hypothetical protein